MAESIKTVSMDDAAEKLREKIKLGFAELIPDEQWNEMIKAEFKKFLEPRTVRTQYGPDRIEPSGFSSICQDVLQKIVRERLEAETNTWKSWDATLSATVHEWMEKNGATIAQEFLKNLLSGALQQFANTMQFPR